MIRSDAKQRKFFDSGPEMLLASEHPVLTRDNAWIGLGRRALLSAVASLALTRASKASDGRLAPHGPHDFDRKPTSSPAGRIAESSPSQRLQTISLRLKQISDAIEKFGLESIQGAAASDAVRSHYDTLTQSLLVLPQALVGAVSLVRSIALISHHVELIGSWDFIGRRLKLAEKLSAALGSCSQDCWMPISLAGPPQLIDEGAQQSDCAEVSANQIILRLPLDIATLGGQVVSVTLLVPLSCHPDSGDDPRSSQLVISRAGATRFNGADFWLLPNAGRLASAIAGTVEQSIDSALSANVLDANKGQDLGNLPSGWGFREHDVLRVWPIACDPRGGLRCYGMLWCDVPYYVMSDGSVRPTTPPTPLPRLSLNSVDSVPFFTNLPSKFAVILKIPTIRTAKWLEWIVWQEVADKVSGDDFDVAAPISRFAIVDKTSLITGQPIQAVLEPFSITYSGPYAHVICGKVICSDPLFVFSAFTIDGGSGKQTVNLAIAFFAFFFPGVLKKIPLGISGTVASAEIGDPFSTVQLDP